MERSGQEISENATEMDGNKWIIDVEKSLKDEPLELERNVFHPVPPCLKDEKTKLFYHPKEISFGPVHFKRSGRSENFTTSENYKSEVAYIFHRDLEEGGLTSLVENLKNNRWERLQTNYSKEMFSCDDGSLFWMLARDCCFVLLVLDRFGGQPAAENEKKTLLQHILKRENHHPLLNDIVKDMFKLENQLPLWALEEIRDALKRPKEDNWFESALKNLSPVEVSGEVGSRTYNNRFHILQLLGEYMIDNEVVSSLSTSNIEVEEAVQPLLTEENMIAGEEAVLPSPTKENIAGEEAVLHSSTEETMIAGEEAVLPSPTEENIAKEEAVLPSSTEETMTGGEEAGSRLSQKYISRLLLYFSRLRLPVPEFIRQRLKRSKMETIVTVLLLLIFLCFFPFLLYPFFISVLLLSLLMFISYRNSISGETVEDERHVPTIEELHRMGVTFKKLKGKGISHIKFSESKATLYLPKFTVDDRSEVILRNLLVMETQWEDTKKIITRYVVFMNDLVNTGMDVALLRRQGIIANKLGDDEDVAQLWNSVTIPATDIPSYEQIDKVSKSLNAYRKKWWRVLWAQFWSLHCAKPWLVASLLGGVSLLSLTILQVFCAFRDCQKKGK